MHKLLYVSSTKRDFPQQQLEEILAVSRTNNAAQNVTGLLLYIDGGFLQVLEGEADVLRRLYAKIEKDTRHWDVRVLLDQVASRNFGEWSMGFKAPRTGGPDEGLVEITESAVRGLIKPGDAQPLLDVLIKTFQTVQGG